MKLKGKLNDYFAPKKNAHYSRYMFLKMRPQPWESTVSYAARLREKAKNCDFHDDDERILEHIIQTTDNQDLIRKVIYKKWTLKQTLEEMQLLEETSIQVKAMGQYDTDDIAKISRKGRDRKGIKQDRKSAESNACIYCDRNHPKQKRMCPAYGKICGKCGNETILQQFVDQLEIQDKSCSSIDHKRKETSDGQLMDQIQRNQRVTQIKTATS